MKKWFIILLLVFCHTANAQKRSARELIVAWEKVWNNYDLNEVANLFVRDSSVTYFSSEYAGLIHGIDSLLSHHRRFGFLPGGKKSDNRLWLSEVRYLPSSVTATWHFQRPGSPEQKGPVTFIISSSRSGFRIQHAHFSNDPKPK